MKQSIRLGSASCAASGDPSDGEFWMRGADNVSVV